MTVGPGRRSAAASAAARSGSVLTAAPAAPSPVAAAANETGWYLTASAPPWPDGFCLISIRLSAASLNTTTMTGSDSRTAVSSSASVMPRPPSPVKATTGTSGRHSAAAIAAGSAYPMVARPLEMSSRPGSGTSHNGIATSMCAPASTVAIVSAGVPARTVRTTCWGVSRPGAAGGGAVTPSAVPAARSLRVASSLAARPASSGQS